MCSKGFENGDLYCPCSLGITCAARDLRTESCIVHAHFVSNEGLENADLYCPCLLGITRTARDLRMQACIVHARFASFTQQGT